MIFVLAPPFEELHSGPKHTRIREEIKCAQAQITTGLNPRGTSRGDATERRDCGVGRQGRFVGVAVYKEIEGQGVLMRPAQEDSRFNLIHIGGNIQRLLPPPNGVESAHPIRTTQNEAKLITTVALLVCVARPDVLDVAFVAKSCTLDVPFHVEARAVSAKEGLRWHITVEDAAEARSHPGCFRKHFQRPVPIAPQFHAKGEILRSERQHIRFHQAERVPPLELNLEIPFRVRAGVEIHVG